MFCSLYCIYYFLFLVQGAGAFEVAARQYLVNEVKKTVQGVMLKDFILEPSLFSPHIHILFPYLCLLKTWCRSFCWCPSCDSQDISWKFRPWHSRCYNFPNGILFMALVILLSLIFASGVSKLVILLLMVSWYLFRESTIEEILWD